MAQKDVGNKIPIYKLKTTDEVMKYYDEWGDKDKYNKDMICLLYTSPSPRDVEESRMPSSA